MKIRAQFTMIVSLFGVILIIVAASLILMNLQVERLQKQKDLAHQVELGIRELSYLWNDYLLHRESHQRTRWEVRFSSFSDLLLEFVPENPEQAALINNLKANKDRLESIFSEVVSLLENNQPLNFDIVDIAIVRVSWSRMEIQNQAIAFDVSRLNRILEEQVDRLQHQRVILLFIFIGVFGAFLVVNYITVNQRILRALSDLQVGTGIIGSGNLEFTLEETRGDEIGELSRAFNRMTMDLKMVTASKTYLEREIKERERAEEALRESKEQIKASLEEKEVLLKEIHHRVKNNMQVISSLVSLQSEELKDADMRAVLQEVTHRVRSMALVHEKLYQSADLARIEFDKYAQSLLNYLWHAHGSASSGVRLSLDLEPISLSVNEAVPCGLILNELVCNSLKHAFDGREDGEMAVLLQHGVKEGQVRLCVRDNGTGFPVGLDWRQARTLGLRLVRMLAGQLRAEVEFSSTSGTEFIMIFGRPKI
jgi:two-component sensor histidine kinase/HAMP domain-containing protein